MGCQSLIGEGMIIDGKVESSERKGKCLQVVKDNQSSLMSRELGFVGGGGGELLL